MAALSYVWTRQVTKTAPFPAKNRTTIFAPSCTRFTSSLLRDMLISRRMGRCFSWRASSPSSPRYDTFCPSTSLYNCVLIYFCWLWNFAAGSKGLDLEGLWLPGPFSYQANASSRRHKRCNWWRTLCSGLLAFVFYLLISFNPRLIFCYVDFFGKCCL